MSNRLIGKFTLVFPEFRKQSRRREMAAYVADVDPARYSFVCSVTGELASGLFDAIHRTVFDLWKFRVLHRWHSARTLQKCDEFLFKLRKGV